MSTNKIHPAATLIPEPDTEQYERLKQDIREHGLRVPILMTPDGQILDGRTRDRVCRELHIVPTPNRQATTEEMLDPTAVVLSLNAVRRHLSADQIAAIYLQQRSKETVAADTKAAKASRQSGLKKGKARGVIGNPTGKTATKIGKKIGVSASTVKKVMKVQRKAPERLADVAKGKVSANEVLKAVKPAPVTLSDKAVRLIEAKRLARDVGRGRDVFEMQRASIEAALGALEHQQEYGGFRPEEVVILGSIYERFSALMRREEG